MILEAIGHDHDYDLDRLREYQMDPAHLQWATIMPDDLSHINSKTGWYKRAPDQEIPRMEGLTFEPERANPAYFLTRDEFLNIYSSIMDDDSCWLPTDHITENNYQYEWIETTDLEEVWDIISEWQFPFKYKAKVKSNNSLLET